MNQGFGLLGSQKLQICQSSASGLILTFASRQHHRVQANVKIIKSTRKIILLVVLMILTFAPDLADMGCKCQNRTTRIGGLARRLIDLRRENDRTVVGWLEDDFHHFGITLNQDVGIITDAAAMHAHVRHGGACHGPRRAWPGSPAL